MLDYSLTYSTSALVDLLGISQQAVSRRSAKEGWQALPREGRGGGSLWIVASMPAETRDLIASALLRQKPVCPAWEDTDSSDVVGLTASDADFDNSGKIPSILPNSAVKNALLASSVPSIAQNKVDLAFAHASDRERRVASARLAFVREVESLKPIVGKEGAVLHILEAAQCGELSPALTVQLARANACLRQGQVSALSRRSLYRWCSDFANGGVAALLPSSRTKDPVPDWAEDFMRQYAKPQNPTVVLAYKDFYDALRAKGCTDLPSIHACRRLLARMSMPEREAGRATGNALLKLRPHKRRSTKELWPTDVYTADGTTFDAEIQHPHTGQAWKPEVTAVLDVATRRCVGLSVNLSENALTILDALRMACCFGGIPAMFYSDNGAGYINKLMQDDNTGMFPRLGIEFTAAIPGRPQGKGLMERAVKTLWVEAAQGLASYTGALMDEDSAHANFKLSRKQIKAGKGGKRQILPTWEAFKSHILRRVEEYNATPHRGLPLFTDAKGRRRHYAPEEYWQTFVMRGFSPVSVDAEIQDELFMPSERRKVRNGWIEFYGGRYYAPELAEFHGESVEVRYNVWNPASIYAWTLEGRKICQAMLDGNTIDYFPQSRIEAARVRREKAQVKRLDAKLQRIVPGAVISLPDTEQPCSPVVLADSTQGLCSAKCRANAAVPAQEDAPVAEEKDVRPTVFLYPYQRFEWLMRHQESQTEKDKVWLADYAKSEEYADMAEFYAVKGIAYQKEIV
jgi:putative transposase